MSDTGNKKLGSDWTALMPKQMIPAANLLAPQLEVAAAVSVASAGIAARMFGIWTNAMFGSFDLKTGATSLVENDVTVPDVDALKAAIREKAAKEDTKAVQPFAKAIGAEPVESVSTAMADDLKKIAGVGPKLEQVLNSMGIRSYAQIAAWTAVEIAKVDEQLKFGGRILRDDWMAQASRLAGEVK